MSDASLSILLVEDNPGDVRLFEEALKAAGDSKFALEHCKSVGEALDRLAKSRPHVIVLDLGLPDAFGVEAIRKIRAEATAVPIVVLTRLADEGLGLQALQDGAQDYLVKGELDPRFLSRALRYAIERHRLQEALRSDSLIDELTGLYNRKGFMAVAGSYVKLAARTRVPFMLAFIDLDGMKSINDAFGHAEGDRALIDAAILLQACMSQSDVLARLGGDEFALLLADAGPNNLGHIEGRLRDQLDLYNRQDGRRYKLAFSVGIVTATPGRPHELLDLLRQADALMYEQKQVKRNRNDEPEATATAETTAGATGNDDPSM